MLPESRVSERAVVSGHPYPVKGPGEYLVDWERGGKSLNDVSEGLDYQLWSLSVAKGEGDDGTFDFFATAPSAGTVLLFSHPNVVSASLAFDQSMNPFVAFMSAGQAKIYWYDSAQSGQVISDLPEGVTSPLCCIDDHREFNVSNSDIVLGYIRGAWLCVRYQRDRYQIEHRLCEVGDDAELVSMAMNQQLRLQFRIRRVTAPINDSYAVYANPLLAETVQNLYERSGVDRAFVDVTGLYPHTLEGFKVATEGGADVMVQSLQQAYFFDPTESDRKLRAVVRGGTVAIEIGTDALADRDDGPLTIDRVQEAELLRKVNVTMVDSSIDYTTNKQTAERRSNKIGAKAESSIEIPITAGPDFQATVAMRRLNIAWGEMQTYEFELPIAYSALVPTDVVALTDKSGRRHRMRLMEIQEDGGVLICKASQDSPWVYDAEAVGVQAPQPTPTTPGLVGDTTVVVLDIPVLRDQDDELGYYVGAVGTGRGWYGAEVQMSTDAGVNVGQSLQITVPSVIGSTLTALAQEVSSEYLSAQTLIVQVPEPPESIDQEALLRYGNRAAVQRANGSWEVLQFQLVEQVSDDTFRLSGLVRGRYATGSLAVPVGARFVMIDDSLTFVQVQQWMTGTTISYRGVSYGQDSDEADWGAFAVDEPVSQQEWPVHYVRALRDGSNKVTVSWIGRGRLGVETTPRHSKYFAGYRVSYSDGFTADTTETTHARAATPSGVTVTVSALNTITGPGPASEAITV